jgi:hypothetical protein
MLLKKGLQFETSHVASCWASAADRSKLLRADQDDVAFSAMSLCHEASQFTHGLPTDHMQW